MIAKYVILEKRTYDRFYIPSICSVCKFILSYTLSMNYAIYSQEGTFLRSSRFIWGTIGLTASITTIVFAVGFAYAANQIWFPKASESLQLATEAPKESMIESKAKLQIVALGDSLTAGTGDNTGKGYVGRVREKLEKETGKPVFVLNNLAIPGYKSDQLLADLALKKTQDALAQADIILLTIGGNDILLVETDFYRGQPDGI